ncbi:MAG: hypothetical protein NVS9B11_12890 [Candidatus Dormibacteraceae bacterium]
MPNPENDSMDPGFEWRLKAALDPVNPPASSPRYASTVMGGARAWAAAPALVAAGAAVLLAIIASVFTGSANPVVWAERAGSTIQSVSHTPEASPSPEPSAETSHSAPASPAAQVPQQPGENEHKDAPEPKQAPEPKETPEPEARAEPAESSIGPSGDH